MIQEAGMKKCSTCGEIKPTTEFYKDRTRSSGLSYRCKECTNKKVKKYLEQNREKRREHARRWREANPEKCRDMYARSKRKMLYGLTHDVYLQMLSDQNNQCAICGMAFEDNKRSKPHVDHDHKTGAVRSLLCGHCNFMLGYSFDNPETLIKGAEYLKQHNQK